MTAPTPPAAARETATAASVAAHRTAFPVGASVTLGELTRDPYAVFRRLQSAEPVSWLAALDMWYVTGYENVRRVLLDTEHFTTAFERSTIHDTFGDQVRTTDGAQHDRYRNAVRADFAAQRVPTTLGPALRDFATRLVDGIAGAGTAEMRDAFASRLPIQAVLQLCDLPLDAEVRVRRWYDLFAAALANYTGDDTIRAEAAGAAGELHAFLQSAIEHTGEAARQSLLRTLVRAPGA
jgi:pulcherriminic acid synthase